MSLESLYGIKQEYKNSTVFLYARKEQLEIKLFKHQYSILTHIYGI